jgi:hypothetical protein
MGRVPRVIRLIHSMPGRMRLRLSWLHESPDQATPLADALAALDASMEVRVRPWTGSVLCSYDPAALDEDRIVAAVRRHTQVATVLRRGESHPDLDAELFASAGAGVSSVRRAITDAFREMNREMMRASEGRLDLGALTGLGFLGLGAAEIAWSRRLPPPPWFNMAWWAYRTFTLSASEDDRGDAGVQAEGAPGAE